MNIEKQPWMIGSVRNGDGGEARNIKSMNEGKFGIQFDLIEANNKGVVYGSYIMDEGIKFTNG